MNSAIIFINNQRELDLARVNLFEKHLIEYTVSQIKRLDIEATYLVGGKDIECKEVVKRDNISEIIDELKDDDGKCLLVSPFYPLIDKEEYERLYALKAGASFVDSNNNLIPVFTIPNNRLKDFESLTYSGIKLDDKKAKRFDSLNDLPYFIDSLREKINNKWMKKGVIITNPASTTIGEDVTIDKNTTIGPSVTIVGNCIIGKNNMITSGSRLKNTVIGNDNLIENSTVVDSTLHNNITISPYCHISDFSELFDNCKLGSSVRIVESRISENTTIEHLTYLGNCVIAKNVKVGSNVTTINNDGRSKHTTIIKQNTIIGSGVNLIAPLTIGEYVMVGAGSTIEQDIKDGDMAIARLYQQNKKGYGYKYTKED